MPPPPAVPVPCGSSLPSTPSITSKFKRSLPKHPQHVSNVGKTEIHSHLVLALQAPPVSRGGGPCSQMAATQGLVCLSKNFIAFDQGCLQGQSMIKGHMRGTDGNCLSGSEDRSLGTERCEAAGRLRTGGLGWTPQLCPNMSDLGPRAVSLWASVSSPVKWEPG